MADTEVLIVGAGPTGLLLACDLARRGISFRIIEKLPAPSDKSRALAIQPRSLEILDQLSLGEAFVTAGTRIKESHFFIDGQEKLRLDLGQVDIEGVPYPYVLTLPQSETEALLTRKLTDLGVTIERGAEVLSFSQDANGVRSTLKRADGTPEQIESRFIVGCDGAHSVVRHGVGIEFQGASYPQGFILADVEADWDMPRDQLRVFLEKSGVVAVFPMHGRQIRIIASGSKDTGDRDPTLADFQSLLERVARSPVKLSNATWLARFRLHHRLSERYSSGRAFLCGDAAHIHSPVGGQGMNTGLQDAWNLGWKLDLVLRRRAPLRLLDTYNEERHPVGQFLLETTDRLFQLATSGGPLVSMVRLHLAPQLAKLALERPALKRLALATITQIAIQYRKSSLVAEASDAPRQLSDGPHAGDRAPDAELLDQEGRPLRVFDLLRDNRHQLLLFSADGLSEQPFQQAFERWRELLRVHVIHPATAIENLRDAGQVARRYAVTGSDGKWRTAHYLLRPDGHVAWRASGSDPAPLVHYLSRHFSNG